MPKCNCGQEAKLLKVKKQGKNFGRNFYICAQPREEQCDFFEWANVEPKEPDWPEIRRRKEESMEWMNAKNNAGQIVAALIQKGELSYVDWYEAFKNITENIYGFRETKNGNR